MAKQKQIYVQDEKLFEKAQKLAQEEGVSFSAFVESALKYYIELKVSAAKSQKRKVKNLLPGEKLRVRAGELTVDFSIKESKSGKK